jgi:predicted TIM-barrel fold metal-dependent hydrolase
MKVDNSLMAGLSLEAMIDRMDSADIDRAFLIAAKVGRPGLKGCYHMPPELVAQAIDKYPDRFSGVIGIDPHTGMNGVRELERAVTDMGFIGAHVYPHWFELAPDHAKYYPFYAKCCELGVPIQLQVGQSMIYSKDYPCKSVGRPVTLDAVSCDFPELILVGIHVGIPWADEMIAMAWKHDNVYIGCDAHSPKYWPDNFVRYINSYGQDKVIFGTDFPVLDFSRTISEIHDLRFKPDVLPKLLRCNAEKIYRL